MKTTPILLAITVGLSCATSAKESDPVAVAPTAADRPACESTTGATNGSSPERADVVPGPPVDLKFRPAPSRWTVDAFAFHGAGGVNRIAHVRLQWEIEPRDSDVVTVREQVVCAGWDTTGFDQPIPYVSSPDDQIWRYQLGAAWDLIGTPQVVAAGDPGRPLMQMLVPELRELEPEIQLPEGSTEPGTQWSHRTSRQRHTSVGMQTVAHAGTYTLLDTKAPSSLIRYEGTLGPSTADLAGRQWQLTGTRRGMFRVQNSDGMLLCADLREQVDLGDLNRNWERRILLQVTPFDPTANCSTPSPPVTCS